jgi:hypothetical protein
MKDSKVIRVAADLVTALDRIGRALGISRLAASRIAAQMLSGEKNVLVRKRRTVENAGPVHDTGRRGSTASGASGERDP